MRNTLLALTVLFTSAGTCQAEDAEYSTQRITAGLRKPVKYVVEQGRALVVEQAGIIKAVVNNVAQPTAFLDLRDRVYSGGNETGLLGLALHPNYATSGRFFVNYTVKTGNKVHTRISEFKKNADGQVDRSQEKIILTFVHPSSTPTGPSYENHKGGEIAFGPDGYLYIGTGDGGAANDPHDAGQRMNTLLAKMLRIDVDHQTAGRAYAIPADNPFVNQSGALPEIYAYGLRNPWRFSFDTATGALWVADVGQNIREEVDIIRKGGNYGWRIMEGSRCFNPNPCSQSGLEKPIYDYDHNTGDESMRGQSITGGFVYHGSKFPELEGKYIYGDYVSQNIWALSYNAQTGEVSNTLLLASSHSPSAFAASAEGDILIIDHNGAVFKLVR